MWLESLLAATALIGSAAALLHMFGWIPPRYKKVLSGIQDVTAQKMAASFESTVRKLAAEQSAGGEAQTREFIGVLKGAMKEAVSEPLNAFVPELHNALVKASQEGTGPVVESISNLAQALGTYGAREMGAKGGATSAANKALNSQQKHGIRQLASNIAGEVAGPKAQMLTDAALAAGLVDDETIENVTNWAMTNPQLMTFLGRKAREKGMVPSEGEAQEQVRSAVNSGFRM